METSYQIPMKSNGEVSLAKLIHDLCATCTGLEMSYHGLLSRPEMKQDYEDMIRIGKDRMRVIASALKAQIKDTDESSSLHIKEGNL